MRSFDIIGIKQTKQIGGGHSTSQINDQIWPTYLHF